jgi:hypothetical protein
VHNDYACFYPDEGSAYMVWRNNVCDSAPLWLRVWTGNIHDLSIWNSYSNVPALTNKGTRIEVEGTVLTTGQNWTPEAQAIIAQAGLEPAYAYLRTWSGG